MNLDWWKLELLRKAPGIWLIMEIYFSEKNMSSHERIKRAVKLFDNLSLEDQHNAEALGRAYAQKYKVFSTKEHNRLNKEWLPPWCIFDDENSGELNWQELIASLI